MRHAGWSKIAYFCRKFRMKDKITAFYGEHKTVFEENFRMVLESFNMEAIHKMRTSTKRLRALFILLRFLSGNRFKARKQLKKIRTLFRYAGHIREIQIEQQLVAAMGSELGEEFPEYQEYLRQREHREIARFLKHLPAYGERTEILDDPVIVDTIAALEPGNLGEQASAFILKKAGSIAANISKPTSNKRIHSNRTHLKQLYYLFDILTALTGRAELLGLGNERIRDIEQYLGEWHDLVNSPVYMNAFLRSKHFGGEKKYAVLKRRIAARRKAMRLEIINTIQPEIRV